MEYELYHWGVKGMKWGVRRKRRDSVKSQNKQARSEKKANMTDEQRAARKRKIKKNAIIVGSSAAAASLAVIGGMMARDILQQKNASIAAKRVANFANKSLDLARSHDKNATMRRVSRIGDWVNTQGEQQIRDARNASFGTAAKNVYNYYRKKKRG